jgi:hypothetical protein
MGPLESKYDLKLRGSVAQGQIRNIRIGEVGAEKQVGKILDDLNRAISDTQGVVRAILKELDKRG